MSQPLPVAHSRALLKTMEKLWQVRTQAVSHTATVSAPGFLKVEDAGRWSQKRKQWEGGGLRKESVVFEGASKWGSTSQCKSYPFEDHAHSWQCGGTGLTGIPAAWEAEAWGWWVQGQPTRHMETCLKETNEHLYWENEKQWVTDCHKNSKPFWKQAVGNSQPGSLNLTLCYKLHRGPLKGRAATSVT